MKTMLQLQDKVTVMYPASLRNSAHLEGVEPPASTIRYSRKCNQNTVQRKGCSDQVPINLGNVIILAAGANQRNCNARNAHFHAEGEMKRIYSRLRIQSSTAEKPPSPEQPVSTLLCRRPRLTIIDSTVQRRPKADSALLVQSNSSSLALTCIATNATALLLNSSYSMH